MGTDAYTYERGSEHLRHRAEAGRGRGRHRGGRQRDRASQSGASVSFDGQAAVITARHASVDLGRGTGPCQRAVSVIVATPMGGAATAVNGFTYDEAAPVITSVAPAAGPIEGGTTITLTGRRFGVRPSVTVGGLDARVLSSTPTTVTVEAPAHAAGVVDVVLSLVNRMSATAPASFTYEDSLEDGDVRAVLRRGFVGEPSSGPASRWPTRIPMPCL